MLKPCDLNQKQADMFRRYRNSSKTTLRDVYKSWSDAKERAFKYCLQDMKEHNGRDMRITGANGFTFSCAYRIERKDGIYLVYHTRCNRFEFKYMQKLDFYVT